MNALHRHEFKQNHEEWIKSVKPTLDPVISAQLREGLDVTDKEVENCLSVRNELRSALNLLLKVWFHKAICENTSIYIF